MLSVTLEKKAAAQTGPLHGGSTEYHSSGNSERDAYNMVSLAAIEKRFPILARHVGVEILAGAA
ncbi:MAG: hypothetical protein J0I98_03895 [Mesorhizobium sp.]|nr:hypothetical protein [Mesorhizobium sp.]MBN9241915.1 hypothetical protein [Mesorhizobium sp.]